MSKLKNELEELAFRHLDPAAFERLRAWVEERRRATEQTVSGLQATLEAKLREARVPALALEGRIKRLFSIREKLRRQKIGLDEVYDLIALRVITPTIRDCYATLGIIHQTWAPVPGRFKDFVAMPRPNGYQSLHTSVVSDRGFPFEVQIRTERMHQVAEEGIAAHWKYKEGRVGAHPDEQYFHWLRQLLETEKDARDPSEFINSLKLDLYPEEVYAFTPQGEVKALPRGATPVDFAYSVHTDVGHTCVGARSERAHGAAAHAPAERRHRGGGHRGGPHPEPRLAELRRHLPRPPQDPALHPRGGEDPLRRARPQAAREGSPALRPEPPHRARARGPRPRRGRSRRPQARRPLRVDRLREALRPPRALAPGARGRPPRADQRPASRRASPRAAVPATPGDDAIKASGCDDLLVFRAGCCNPIRGEPIVGYVTRGKGVSVHASTCPNVVNLLYHPERRIEVAWDTAGDDPGAFTVCLTIQVQDRRGMLADVTARIAEKNTNIRRVEADVTDSLRGRISVTMDVDDLKHLQRVIRDVRGVPGVIDVERVLRQPARPDGRVGSFAERNSSRAGGPG